MACAGVARGRDGGSASWRALGRVLLTAEGENAFLKGLVGAWVVDSEDARSYVISQLRAQAPALRKIPEETLRDLAVLIRLWIPEMRIPRADRETAALLEELSR